MVSDNVFTASELIDCFQISRRQLQWWAATKAIVPTIYKHAREYRTVEAVLVGMTVALDKSMSFAAMRETFPKIRARIEQDDQTQYVLIGLETSRKGKVGVLLYPERDVVHEELLRLTARGYRTVMVDLKPIMRRLQLSAERTNHNVIKMRMPPWMKNHGERTAETTFVGG